MPTLFVLSSLALAACSGSSDEAPAAPPEVAEDIVGLADAPTDSGSAPGKPTLDAYRAAVLSSAGSLTSEWLAERMSTLAEDDMEGRNNLTPGGQKARAYLLSEVKALGLEPAGKDEWIQPFVAGYNIVALLPGADPELADEYVLVTAHYDHLGRAGDPSSQCKAKGADEVCNGAGDNASGCAGALGVAKALLAAAHRPPRSVLFVFFDAEEDGLGGSTHFARDEPLVPLSSVAAVVNLDMLGTEIVPGLTASFALGVEYSAGLEPMLDYASSALDVVVYPVSSFFDGSKDGERSDHYPFRLEGVPGVFLGSGAPREYHTAKDEISIVSLPRLRDLSRFATILAAEAAFAPAPPTPIDSPAPAIRDAVAMAAVGDAVLADPSALGIDDPATLLLLEEWVQSLKDYVAAPPTTAGGWEEYDEFVRAVVETAYTFIAGG